MKFLAITVVVFAFCGASAHASGPPPLWQGLKPGVYPVGFVGHYAIDPTRGFYRKRDYRGSLTGFSGKRPIRFSIWFPGQPGTGTAMRFRDYVNFRTVGKDAAGVEAILSSADLGSDKGGGIHGVVRGAADGFERLMDQPMFARHEARPAKGRFPLIVYSLGQNDYNQESLVLFEYLASQGYVVVTVPHLGTGPRRSSLWIYEPTSFEVQLRDLEFAMATALRSKFVDPDRVAAIGHSMGGTYALLLAMRNPTIDAVAGLDASLLSKRPGYEFDISTAPYFDPSNLRMPIFQQYRGGDNFTSDIVDGAIYADRWLLRYDKLTHGDFQDAPFYAAVAAPGWGAADELAVRPVEEAVAGHRATIERLKLFLDWALRGKGDFPAAAKSESGGRATPSVLRSLPGLRSPNAEEFYQIVVADGIDKALDLYRQISAANGGATLFAEAEIRKIINEQVYGDNPGRALLMARLYAQAYPRGVEAQSVLARAYDRVGQTTDAVRTYRHILDLDPNNETAKSKLAAPAPAGSR